MVNFQGPNVYIVPRRYVAGQKSKQVLPGWNFAVFHPSGTPQIVGDKSWLPEYVTVLVAQYLCPKVKVQFAHRLTAYGRVLLDHVLA